MLPTSAMALFLYFGGTAILCWLFYIFQFQQSRDTSQSEKIIEEETLKKEEPSSGKTGVKRKPVKPKKELVRKDSIEEFNHHWLVGTLKGHTASVSSLSMSPNNHFLASAAEDRTVLVWTTKDFQSRDHKQIRVNVGFDSATRVHWSPDNKAFAVARKDERITEVFKLGKKPDGSVGNIQSALKFSKVHRAEIVGLGISCNGKYIMSCSADNKLVIWDLKGSVLEEKLIGTGVTYAAKVSPCARYVMACGRHDDDPDIVIYNVNLSESGDYKPMTVFQKLKGHKQGVYSFDISTDSNKIVTIGVDGVWRLFDTSGNRVDIKRSSSIRASINDENIPAVAISHNCRVILIGAGQNLEFYSARSGEFVGGIESAHNEPIKDVTFTIDDKYFISCGDRIIRVFNNVPGFEETIADLKDQIQDKSTSRALKSRMITELEAAEKHLKTLLEEKDK